MINGISGIKRKTTAAEGTKRYFQTVNLIISHFRREADKKKIFELLDEGSLIDLFLTTATIHLYHNLGIRVEDALDGGTVSVSSTKKLEMMEKKKIKKEITQFLDDSIQLEIDIFEKKIDLENSVLEFLQDSRIKNLSELETRQTLTNIENKIENHILEIVRDYPSFYFYDFIGDLIGISEQVKYDILEKSSDLKNLSVEIEKRLKMEEKEDDFIEISSLNHIIKIVKERFEITSHKELETQAMPLRMIKKAIKEKTFNKYPISVFGLRAYRKANEVKEGLLLKIKEKLNQKLNYNEFENECLKYLRDEIISQLQTNPNDFIYFMENLNESQFEEIIYFLNKHGIYNVIQMIGINDEKIQAVRKNMIRYNIDKYDIMKLEDYKKDPRYLLSQLLCDIDIGDFRHFINEADVSDTDEKSLLSLLIESGKEHEEIWRYIQENGNMSQDEVKDFIRKKKVIDDIFLEKINLKNYSQILIVLEFDELLEKLIKEIFYYIISKILRQLSRIIELYHKISNEKNLFLLAIKKIRGTKESEEWVRIKLEELLIQRLVKRQKELQALLNVKEESYIINGFILARLRDHSLEDGVMELKEEDSPIYEGVESLVLKKEILSPVSYCLAYDILKRFENYEELRKLKVKRIQEEEKQKEKKKKELIRKKQEDSTFNWIERRITSSLMRITSPGINPNQLYWKEKDTRIAADNLKMHSELDGNTIDLLTEYFKFAVEKIDDLKSPNMKLPGEKKIRLLVKKIINNVLKERLKKEEPSISTIENMIEGERIKISKEIAKKIGKILDKSLYKKFKFKRRNGR
ncbi:MAG: hypothetical protein R6U96_11805 [Promethearchaeia archaeon]